MRLASDASTTLEAGEKSCLPPSSSSGSKADSIGAAQSLGATRAYRDGNGVAFEGRVALDAEMEALGGMAAGKAEVAEVVAAAGIGAAAAV